MKQSLIEKYDIQAPRYTSYPPVPYWEKAPASSEWFGHIAKTFEEKNQSCDLYIHVPFCQQICHYCGCNRIKSSDQDLMRQYVETLLLEWKLYKKNLGDFNIASWHLGGGTPTWLTPFLLEMLLEGISSRSLSGSVEIDPRVTSEEHLRLLFQKGIRRLSLGIQDFHPEVQKKIGRIQKLELVEELVTLIRTISFEELNFDLIFGLPGQSADSLVWTIEQVTRLRPETIAFYSFAYVPHFAQNQSNINMPDVPQGAFKRRLYELGRELLFKNGYQEIGMDHFALPSSSLATALKNKNLTRSFMGYTVRKAPVLVALGTSAIGSSGLSFIQNEKSIPRYMDLVKAGELPIVKGHIQSLEDLESERIIQEIMCLGETDIGQKRPEALEGFHQDALIKIDGNILVVTETGRPFLRNIAHAFDHRVGKVSSQAFSRTV